MAQFGFSCAPFLPLSREAEFLQYIFFYRILGLLAHLLNIWLVTTVLHKTKHSSRIVVLGTLLYAWNPLVLLESSLGGHNDIVMVTCLLSGIALCVRAEQNGFLRARQYLPPIVVFTCAALIKFTAAPIIVFYLVLLARRVFIYKQLAGQQEQTYFRNRWLVMLRVVSSATFLSCCLASILYVPLWFGHSLHDIAISLGSPPSSRLAFGSLLLAFQRGSSHERNVFLTLLGLHSTWNVINALVVAGFFCLGGIWIYRTPTTLTVVQATLALLGALLIVTPWFFPWYVLWIVSLAALCLPTQKEPVKRALVSSTLVFSASAFLIYLFRGYPPIGDWRGLTSLTTIGPPLITLLFLLLTRKHADSTPQYISGSVEEATNLPVP